MSDSQGPIKPKLKPLKPLKLGLTGKKKKVIKPLVTPSYGIHSGPQLELPHDPHKPRSGKTLKKTNHEDKDIAAEGDKPAIKISNHDDESAKKAYQEFLNEYDIYDDYNYDIYHHRNYDSYKKLQEQDFRLVNNDNINVNYGLILFFTAILIGLCLLVVLVCLSAGVGAIISYIMFNPAFNRTSSKKVDKVKENDDDILQSSGFICYI